MPVFRVERNRNYTTMSNYHLRDKDLSLKAKGLLSMCLSLTESWDYSVNGLVAISKEGRDAILSAVRELEQAGYIVRSRERDERGCLRGAEYAIYEVPQSPETDSPALEKPTQAIPTLDNPAQENPAQLRTDQSNTKTINNAEKKAVRHRYGSYENVLLSDIEMEQLRAEFPMDYQNRIERMSEYIACTGRGYKNYLAALRSWARREKPERPKYSHADYTFKEGESL